MLPGYIEMSYGNNNPLDIYRLERKGEAVYIVYLEGDDPLFEMERDTEGTWKQSAGEPVSKEMIQSFGEDLNSLDEEEFEFHMLYGDKTVLCKIGAGETGFAVLFDGKWVAEVNKRLEGFGWEVIKGEKLDEMIVYDLGERIERFYSA
jgi:hypothetical protein